MLHDTITHAQVNAELDGIENVIVSCTRNSLIAHIHTPLTEYVATFVYRLITFLHSFVFHLTFR